MKKIFTIVMSVMMIACFMSSMAFADPLAGENSAIVPNYNWYNDGTGDSYTISTAADLLGFANIANGTAGDGNPEQSDFSGKTVTLANDIDLAGIEWTPIGEFSGILDGNNKTIYGLSITSGTSNIGLFTYLKNSTVKNLTIANAKIDLSNVADAQRYIGVLAGGSWNSTITNVTVENVAVSTKAQYVGGIYGAGWGSITGCTVSDSVITGKDQVGGLVGYLWIGSIGTCNLNGNTITATEERAGGIVGKLDTDEGNSGNGVSVTGCTVSGGSANAPDFAGGIAAQFMGNQNVYSITGNTVENFALNAEEEKSALATIRKDQNSDFTSALGTNVTGNTLEDISSTLDESWEIKSTYGTGNDAWVVYQRCEAKIDSVKYATIAEALSVAQTDDTLNKTVTLLKNVTIKSANTISKNIIIDLNGKTLNGEGSGALTVNSGATLTIKDSKGGGTIGESLIAGKDAAALSITGGTFSTSPKAYVTGDDKVYKYSDSKYVVAKSEPAHTSGMNTWTKNSDGIYVESYVSRGSSGSSSSSSTTTTTTDNVSNTTEDKKTDTSASTGTTTVATTTATVKTETKTATDGTKTVAATVDSSTATKIVEKAVENKSEEVVIDTATATTTGTTAVTETAAGTTTKVDLPEQTVKAIAEKTEAAVTIKSDAAEVKLDTEAVKAVAEQAGDTGTVNLVVETVAQNETKVEVDLKLVTSKGNVSDFKGGNVTVTVKLNTKLAAKPVVCVYIDDNGTYHKVKGVKNADGTYTFETGHFSTYAVMEEEEADKVIAEQTANVDKLVSALSLKARSAKTKAGNIKITLTADSDAIKAIEDLGYTVKYKFYRSAKKAKGYKAKIEGTGKTYTNTTGKKGTKYYYKARVMVYDAQGEVIAKSALTQCKYAARTK